MHNEIVCTQIRHDIEQLLVDARPATSRTAFSAARATRDIADALHHAAGLPNDPRWSAAMTSLERFLAVCRPAGAASARESFASLRGLLEENLDAVA
jgi:hypothetical protein